MCGFPHAAYRSRADFSIEDLLQATGEIKNKLTRFRDLIAYRIVISMPRCHLKPGDNREEIELNHLYEIASALPDFLEQRGFTAEVLNQTGMKQSSRLNREVQQKDYERLMGKNPSPYKGEKLPVQNVSYFDAIEYCNKISRAEGLKECYKVSEKNVSYDTSAEGYRLLTEAEWEYACRAGTTTIFNTGNWNNVNDANYQGSYPYLIEENYIHHTEKNVVTGMVRNEPIDVDSLKPNAFGLYNMHGNVSEWVFDFYGEYDMSENQNPFKSKNLRCLFQLFGKYRKRCTIHFKNLKRKIRGPECGSCRN